MKQLTCFTLFLVTLTTLAGAQSPVTEKLQSDYPDALNLFFYHNTLRMLNQQEDEAFDEVIRDIEKMRLLMIKKEEHNFNANTYSTLVKAYRSEHFQPVMTVRHDGRNFDIYLKEKEGQTSGMLVLVNDPKNLWVLDILGAIAPDKVAGFLSALNENTDISQKISEYID